MQRAPSAMLPGLVGLLGLAVAACGGADEPAPFAPGEAPPSILLISIDTLRPDHLGLYGYERDTSPYLDRLAEECLVFDRAYTTAPWTLSAHMSMLTGLQPEDHGVTAADVALSPAVPTVAERLRAHGYRTIGLRAEICTWLDPRYGFDRGFDVYAGHQGAPDAVALARKEVGRVHASRPLFLFLHLFDVHTAFFDEGFTGFYDPPPPFDTLWVEDAHERLAHVDCMDAWEGRADLTPAEIEAMIALYDGGVRHVDAQLEKLIEGWRADGLLERALLIIVADHGESLGEHGSIGGHGGMYEEGLRVPLLVRFPDGYRAGERERGLASLVDLPATILDTADLPLEPWRAGRSLREVRPKGRVVRATRALISREWKMMLGGESKEVYSLTADADELDPGGKDDPQARAVAKDLRARYEALRAAREPVPGQAIEIGDLDAESAAELRDLGYAGELDD